MRFNKQILTGVETMLGGHLLEAMLVLSLILVLRMFDFGFECLIFILILNVLNDFEFLSLNGFECLILSVWSGFDMICNDAKCFKIDYKS